MKLSKKIIMWFIIEKTGLYPFGAESDTEASIK